jgi:hypothetical protein
MGEKPVTHLAHRHVLLLHPRAKQIVGRTVPQEIKLFADHGQRGPCRKELDAAERMRFMRAPRRNRQVMREGKFVFHFIEVGLEFSNVTVEAQELRAGVQFEPGIMSPAREPLQQIDPAEDKFLAGPIAVWMMPVSLGEPLNEFPIVAGKQFLLVRRTRRQLHNFAERFDLLAGARTENMKLNCQAVEAGIPQRRRAAQNTQRSARRIKVRRLGRVEPAFEVAHQALLLLSLFDFRKAIEVGVGQKFGGQRPLGAQE